MSYTVFKIDLNGNLSNKENLNNKDELMNWLNDKYGTFMNVRIHNDETGEIRNFSDNGEMYVWVK